MCPNCLCANALHRAAATWPEEEDAAESFLTPSSLEIGLIACFDRKSLALPESHDSKDWSAVNQRLAVIAQCHAVICHCPFVFLELQFE